MQALSLIAGISLFGLIAVYLFTFFKFHKLVQAERPDWVNRQGSLSFFYKGLPRASDPNVTVAVLRTVLSSRVRELRSPLAVQYARRLRVLLIVIPAVFGLILWVGLANAP